MDELNKFIFEEGIKMTLEETTLKNGVPENTRSGDEMKKFIVEEGIKMTLEETTLKNGVPKNTRSGDFTYLHINPTGKLLIGSSSDNAPQTSMVSSDSGHELVESMISGNITIRFSRAVDEAGHLSDCV